MARKFITNICGGVKRSDIRKVGLSDAVNMFVEPKDATEQAFTMVMRSISGCSTFCTPSGEPRGMFKVSRNYNGNGEPEVQKTYGVWGDTLYMLDEGDAVVIGKLATSSGTCHFCETGGYGSAHPHLVITDGINVYALNTGIRVVDQRIQFNNNGTIRLPYRVNSTTELIKPTHCAYLYGYLVVNDAGTDAFYTSYQYPFEKYDPSEPEYYDVFMLSKTDNKGFITYSEWQPDNTLALYANGSRLYTFGSRSYQVFQYNNDVNYPFVSPDTAAKNIGIKAVDSLCGLGDIVCWLGGSDVGNNGIYVNNGGVDSERISTIEIEELIGKLDNVSDAIGQMWQENRHTFYALTFTTAKVTIVYDFLTQEWHKRASLGTRNELNAWRYRYAQMNEEGKILFADQDACVVMDNNKWTEHDGKKIMRKRVGGVIYADHLNFVCDFVRIVTNNGQNSNVAENALITIRYSFDGATFSSIEQLPIGRIGEYDYETMFYLGDWGRYLTIEISCVEDCPFALMGIEFGGEAMDF